MSFLARPAGACVCLLLAGAHDPEEIVVRGDRDDARQPASFTTVVRPDGQPGPLVDLADLLRTAAGVDLRRDGGAGRAAEVRLRGAGSHQVAVFLDEVPLTGSRGGAFDLSTLPPAYVDRVEIVRGPAAAAYGGGAMGGVLHLRTREVGPGTAGTASLHLGSYGLRQLDGALAHGAPGHDVLAVVRSSAAEGDFPFEDVNGETRRRRNDDHALASALARARFATPGGRLTLLAEGLSDTRGEPGFEQFQNEGARSRRRRILGAAGWTGSEGPVAGSVVLSGLRGGSVFEDPREPGRPFTGLAGVPTRYETDDTTILGSGRLSWTAEPGHRPALAVEARREAAETRVEGPQVFAQARDEQRTSMAVALSEHVVLGDLTLLGLARIDDTDDRGALLVPHGGAVWAALDGLELRANAGRLFRDPSFDELYFYGAGIVGNPDLRPEDGFGWDAGLRLRVGDWGSLEAVWFEQRYDRLVLFVQDTAWLVRARDDFGATATGQEVAAAVRWGPLALDAAYTHLDARFDFAPHPPLPLMPEHRLFARAALRADEGRVYAAVDARGERTADRFGLRRLDGHALWDLGVDGPVGAGFRAGLEVRNALDERGAIDAVQRPLPGRTLLFALRFDGEGERP